MTAAEGKMGKDRRSRGIRVSGCVIAVLTAVGVAPFLFWAVVWGGETWQLRRVNRQVQTLLSARGEAGWATNVAPGTALPPAADNAAPIYVAIQDLTCRSTPARSSELALHELACRGQDMISQSQPQEWFVSFYMPTGWDLASAASGLLDGNPMGGGARHALAMPEAARYLELLATAAARPECVFKTAGTNDYLPTLYRAAMMALIEAMVRAADGDADGAAEALLRATAVAEHLRRQPRLEAQLVALQVDVRTAWATRRVAETVELAPDQSVRLAAALAGRERRQRLADAVDRAVFVHATMQYTAAGGPRSDPFLVGMPYRAALVDAAARRDLVLTPWWDRAARQRLQADVDTERHLLGAPPPGVNRIDHAAMLATAEAYVVTTRTGLALLRYRRDHDELPPSLEPLVPDYLPQGPVDPWTGERLPYECRADGWSLTPATEVTPEPFRRSGRIPWTGTPSWEYTRKAEDQP